MSDYHIVSVYPHSLIADRDLAVKLGADDAALLRKCREQAIAAGYVPAGEAVITWQRGPGKGRGYPRDWMAHARIPVTVSDLAASRRKDTA